MPTQSGDLTKEEILSSQLHVRQDSTFVHLDAEATLDGRSVTANVDRVRRSVRKPSFSVTVGQVAETLQGAYEDLPEQEDKQATAL
jgi:hypothetical protein